MTTSASTARIAIVGAGPGGLTCARILQQHGIAVSVFERDSSATSRPQGGSLDMHLDSGQIALREAGLYDEFVALARPEGQAVRVLDLTGAVAMEVTPDPDEMSAPEIDRIQLRLLLCESLAAGAIRWDHNLRAVEPVDNGVHRLVFDRGADEDFDLVIGADGVWSKVRPIVSDVAPVYTGVTFVETVFDRVHERHADLVELVGDGMMQAFGDNKGLFAHRLSNDQIAVNVALRMPEDWYRAEGVDIHDTQAVRAALLARFADYDQRFHQMITDNDGAYISRPMYVLPVPHTWSHRPGVTLLGDAAHVMSPFGGRGANLSMLDAADLALAIAHEETIEAALVAYEQTMFPRAIEAAERAATGLAEAFTPGDDVYLADFEGERAAYVEKADGRT